MKLLLTIALYGVLAGLVATRPRADDIDIYQPGTDTSPTRVMLAVDLREEAADILCEDAAQSRCEAALGAELYAGLDLLGSGMDADGQVFIERSADGVADVLQEDPAGIADSLAAASWAGVAVDRYDMLRSALGMVLTKQGERLRGAVSGRRVEVGLMALHADDCTGAGPQFLPDYELSPEVGCSQGAYVLQGFTDISEPAGLARLLRALAALPDPGRRAPWMAAPWPGHPYKIRDIYLELHRYLTGQAVFNGFLGTADFGSQSGGNLYHSRLGDVTNDVLLASPEGVPDQPLLAPDIDILEPSSLDLATNRVSDARYISPLRPREACAKISLVNLQAGAASPSHPDTSAAVAAPLATGGMGVALAAGDAGDRALVALLAGAEAGAREAGSTALIPVRSYFLTPVANANSDALAAAGGTGHAYSLAEPGAAVAALAAVFAGVTGESRTLVAGAMVVNDPGKRLSGRDIYYALFRPEPAQFWPGNVKKLKIARLAADGAATGDDAYRDVVAQAPLTNPPQPALSAEDGLILADALTFWTDPAGADVQAFDAGRQEVAGRDGRAVTRGGAGQQVTGYLANTVSAGNGEPGARQLFTLDPDEPGRLLALDASAVALAQTAAMLDPAGDMSEEEGLDLLRWIRGQDSLDADGDGDLLESRSWLLGDPLHSRPLAISYGARPGTAYSAGNPDVRIFFGSNDGVFHVLRNTTEAGAESGRESWAFIPPELLGMQPGLAHDRSAVGGGHPYGLDGEAVAQIEDRDGDGNIEIAEGDSVRVFIGQRRGGRAIYAFDMSDPDNPRYLWTINHLSRGFEQLALTFSTPRVARLDLGEATPTAVLVFAGGYNGGWAGAARVGKDVGAEPDLIGNAIYVVNPADGSLIWRAVGPNGAAAPAPDEQLFFTAGLLHSIPSPVTVIDADHNGVDDRAYVGDSGGTVWRIELTEGRRRTPGTAVTDPANWYLSRLAALGGGGTEDRRFFHAPDVVQSRDATGDYDGVVIVSGNRAAPRELAARNFAYLLKDRNTAADAGAANPSEVAISHAALADITAACSLPAAGACAAADLGPGWKLALQAPGEKGLSAPLVTSGRVLFTSYIPFTGEGPEGCAATEGSSRVYGVSLGEGAPALVLANRFKLRDGEIQEDEELSRFQAIGPGLKGDVVPYRDAVLVPGGGAEGDALLPVPGRSWWRAYWREDGVDSL